MASLPAMSNQPCAAPATVAEVANEFLALAAADGAVVDQMKLQKLVFYAHAWHLAYNKAPLFENDIEAWPWGPVVRDIYMQTKDYGRAPVTEKLYGLDTSNGAFNITTPDGAPAALKPFLKSVWDTLKKFNGVQLSNSTHAPGEPWTIIAEKLGTSSKPLIPNELIQQVFEKKIKT
jgi:uncharacterized phage-associated protein